MTSKLQKSSASSKTLVKMKTRKTNILPYILKLIKLQYYYRNFQHAAIKFCFSEHSGDESTTGQEGTLLATNF